jgi:enoyl-CoA hydratase/carnithine racemase
MEALTNYPPVDDVGESDRTPEYDLQETVGSSVRKAIEIAALRWKGDALAVRWIEPLETLIVTKRIAGFDAECIENLARLYRAIARGELTGAKYLVLDFAHQGSAGDNVGEGFAELVAANAELVFHAPVITIAWARSGMRCSDLEFALHCPIIVAEEGAQFSFDGDPGLFFGLYAALARKIGFVKAERLFERGESLSASGMRDLYLVKEVVEPQAGMVGVERFVAKSAKRHNAAHAIFRAQSMAMPAYERKSGSNL